MSLPNNHIIRKALAKSQISKDLIKEFCKFLSQFPHWEQQAVYLFQDKHEPIETIVEDLYAIPVGEQANWKEKKNNAQIDDFDEMMFETTSKIFDYQPELLFNDWKQEHGFDAAPPEIGDIHTFIRFERFITKNQEEKFLWTFNRARLGKRSWGNEKIFKSLLKSILDNNNNPGWVVKTFLEENILICNKNNEAKKGIDCPNPFLLSSRDTHSLLFLLLGNPYLFIGDSPLQLRNAHNEVSFEIHHYSFPKHQLLYGHFFYYEDKKKKEIDTEEFIEEGIILRGLPKAVIYRNYYYKIADTTIPARMIVEAFKGILVPNDEWKQFEEQWQNYYPELDFKKIDVEQEEVPNFSVKNLKYWNYWLIRPEIQEELYEKEDDITSFHLHKDTFKYNGSRLALEIKGPKPGEHKFLNLEKHPKTKQLFLFLEEKIKRTSLEEDILYLEKQSISQFLILAEEYKYAFGYDGKKLISDEKFDFTIFIKKDEENSKSFQLHGEIKQKGKKSKQVFKKNETPFIIGIVPSFVFYEGQFIRLNEMVSGRLVSDTLSGITIGEKEISSFYWASLPYLRQRGINIHDPHGLLRVSALYNYTIHGKMTIWEIEGILMGRLEVMMKTDIGDFKYPMNEHTDTFVQKLDNKRYEIERSTAQEMNLKEEVFNHGWVDEGNDEFSMNSANAMNFVLNILPSLENSPLIQYYGIKKLKRWRTKQLVPSINTSIKSGINWFDVDLQVKSEGNNIDMRKIVELWKKGEQAIEMPGQEGIAVLDKEWINKFAPIINRLVESSKVIDGKIEQDDETKKAEEEKLKVEKYQLGLLNELEEAAAQKEHDDQWEKILKSLQNFKGIKKIKIPNTVNAKLRDYQLEGVNWLCFLREYSFGGILADDMGLGKTLQALTFLAVDQKNNKWKKPNLVIAPTSVVVNWQLEAEKFFPSLHCVLLHGQKRKEFFKNLNDIELIITTYGLLQKDLEILKSYEFTTIILDEAQMIKNVRSKTAAAVSELTAEFRLALTGTPIENSISELWSQFNFLMPGFMGSIKEFQELYIKPNQRKNEKRRPDYSLLRRQTRPFILRRMKQHVAKELPKKVEQTLYCEMNDKQKKLYDSVLSIIRQQLVDKITIQGMNGVKIMIFDALLRLRQICCDPRLSNLAPDNPPPSAKLQLFVDTVSSIVEEGHRVLVFSQFVKMLKLIQKPLEELDIPFLQLDGSTHNRQEYVNKFQNSDEYPVFLISLKAGGTGLNLTAADYVIHYDPWWNPAVESQATDRAYRIGQKKSVHVYKLITKNTIEEKILNLQHKKSVMANKIVASADSFENIIDIDDIKEIFNI